MAKRTLENGFQHVELLEGIEDAYGGIIVDMTEPMESSNFVTQLRASLSQWKKQVLIFFLLSIIIVIFWNAFINWLFYDSC